MIKLFVISFWEFHSTLTTISVEDISSKVSTISQTAQDTLKSLE